MSHNLDSVIGHSDGHSDTSGPPGLHVLWCDKSCLLIDKPCGLSTQAPSAFDSVEARVRRWLADRVAPGNVPYLGLPHRLDRCTSGVLLLALRARAARKLARQFERREVDKCYWALVEGEVTPPSGTWRDCLRKIPDQPRAEIVTADVPGAREAVLDYRVKSSHAASTWIELRLHTGRMHQIRVQAATRGWPIVGDTTYGAHFSFGPVVADVREQAIALHARSLKFRHPATGTWVTVEAPMPSFWRNFVNG